MPHCAWRAQQQCSALAASRLAAPRRATPSVWASDALIPAALHQRHQIFTALAGARQGLGDAGVTVQKLSTGDGMGRRRAALAGRRRSRLARAWAGGGLIFRRVSPATAAHVRSRVSTGATVNPTLSRWRAALAGRRHSRLAITWADGGLLKPQQCSARAASRRATPHHAIPPFSPRQFVSVAVEQTDPLRSPPDYWRL